MGVEFTREKVSGYFPVFWRGETKVLPGDFKIKQTLPVGTTIPRGTALQLDFDNMQASLVKVGFVVSGGTTTKPRVQKGTLLQVGDVVMKVGKDDNSPTVSSIDRSDPNYDEVTLSAAITGLTEGDFLVESSEYVAAAGEVPAVPAAPLYSPDAVTAEPKEVEKKDFLTVAASYEAVILKKVAYPIPSIWKNNYSLKANPSIKYINQ